MLAVNIFVSRKMRYRFLMLVVFGFLFLPLYVHLEPDMFYVVQFFVGVVVTAIATHGPVPTEQQNNVDTNRMRNVSFISLPIEWYVSRRGRVCLQLLRLGRCCFLCLFHRRIITTDIPIPHGNRAQRCHAECASARERGLFVWYAMV